MLLCLAVFYAGQARSAPAKKRCHIVVKVVHGKKKRVRVCKNVKPKPPDPLAGSKAVSFRASDGVPLEGRLWGASMVGVVLVHGDSDVGQGMWFAFAPVLVAHGYRALTFNLGGYCPRRGYGCSGGPRETPDTWLDVAAAVDYLRSQGIQKVFVVGGSLGGHTALWAASRPGFDAAGVISLSAPQNALGGPDLHYDLTPDILRQIREPKLFMAGLDEPQSGYSPADDARSMYNASEEPKQLALLPSSLHASALLTVSSAVKKQATQTVLDFLAAHR